MAEEQLSGAFWGGDDLSEEEEFDDEEEEEEEYSSDGGFLSDSDDEDEERGPVLSGEVKADRDLVAGIEKLMEELDADNWIGVQKEWEIVKGVVTKYKRIWKTRPDGKPKKYVIAVADIEDRGSALSKDKTKKRKMEKLNQKAFNAVFPKVKKANVRIKDEIALYKKDGAEEYLKDPEVVEPVEEEEKEETKEDVDKELGKMLSQRGKKNYDKHGQLAALISLREKAKDEEQELRIMLNTVGAYFDLTSMEQSFDRKTWLASVALVNEILDKLANNTSLSLNSRGTAPVTAMEGSTQAYGSPINFLERLDDEFTKQLQDIDHHRSIKRYIERLGDLPALLALADKTAAYYKRRGKQSHILRTTMVRLRNVYYMPPKEGDSIDELVNELYKSGNEKQKTVTALYHAYYLANHGDFYRGRDLMLMTRMQEAAQSADIPTQILHNRAMGRLGICAFDMGLIYEAHSCLSDLCSGSRTKELLGQGTTNRYGDRYETEKLSKRMHVPYHMHINLDVLETVHLISAMLMEVPNIAAGALESRRRTISRALRKYIDYVDRQFYAAPPENTRETVVAASKLLLQGDWKAAYEQIVSLKVWALIPGAERIQVTLRRKIQEEGLRTYLFAFSNFYDSINQEELSALFELPPNTVHSIVSKMIINDDLHAAWDQPTRCVVIHKLEPSRSQALFLQFTEKIGSFVENNERILEARAGGYSYKFDSKSGKDGRWRDDNSWGGRDKRNNSKKYDNNRRNNGSRGNYRDNNNRDNRNRGGNNYRDNNRRNDRNDRRR